MAPKILYLITKLRINDSEQNETQNNFRVLFYWVSLFWVN